MKIKVRCKNRLGDVLTLLLGGYGESVSSYEVMGDCITLWLRERLEKVHVAKYLMSLPSDEWEIV